MMDCAQDAAFVEPTLGAPLEAMLEKAHADSNLINKGSGYCVTAMV